MFVDFNILNQLGSPSINSNTFANRPAAGQTGRLFVSTDTFEIYRDNGTTWDLIGGPGSSTITGTGTATQVAYFTSSQAIGSSANLFWDNTSGFLGVATATPSARIEAVKTDGIGIYANYTTNAGSGSSATAIWAKNVTNGSGFAAVIEETTPNTTAGQYPLLIKHSLSSGTAGVGMGTGIHWQLPDDAGTFKTTQLTVETTNAAAATYATRYRFNVQSNGSSTPVAYINSTGLGIFTATPGAALDIHSTGIMAQLNSTSATANSLLVFQRSGSGLWRIGDVYNGGPNYFELYNTVLGINAMQVFAATNKTSWQATENYTSGVARGNYFDYNLTLNPANPLASPNAISAVGASLDLTLEGSITIPSGARSGLDAYNSIRFTTTGTLTHNQGTQIRAYSNLTAGWAFNGSATGTITHLAGLRALFPDNTGSAIAITNNYALLLNDQTANTGTVTYTNRWGVYQEGASDLNYMAANLLLGSTVNNGNKLQVTGYSSLIGNVDIINGSLNFGGTGIYTSTDPAIYRVAGNDLAFALGSAEKMRLTNIGYLGIGTNAPSYKLDVNGDISGKGAFYGFTGATLNLLIDWSAESQLTTLTATNLFFGTNATRRMTITSAGLVGIGTSTPSGLFQLNGVLATPSDAANLTIKQSGTTYTDGIYLERAGERNGYYMYIGGSTDSLNFRRNYFGTQTNVLSLNREGYILTNGLTAPVGTAITTSVQIKNASGGSSSNGYGIISANDEFSGGTVLQSSSTNAIAIVADPDNLRGSSSIDFFVDDAVTSRMRVNNTGNVLIGTTTDAGYKLDVSGGNSFFRGGTVFQGPTGPASDSIGQRIVGTSTAAASTVAKKIIYCDHTNSITVKVIAYQDTANNASITADFCTSYGANNIGNNFSSAVGNVTAISLAYNNAGSPSYTIDCTVTYTGTAPTLYIIVDGIARSNMSII